MLNELEQLDNKNHDYATEIKDIQQRIQARENRTDHVCWNCRKAMGRRMSRVPLLRRGPVTGQSPLSLSLPIER